jgi:hypothetical protein
VLVHPAKPFPAVLFVRSDAFLFRSCLEACVSEGSELSVSLFGQLVEALVGTRVERLAADLQALRVVVEQATAEHALTVNLLHERPDLGGLSRLNCRLASSRSGLSMANTATCDASS